MKKFSDSSNLVARKPLDSCLGCRRCFSTTSANRIRSKNYRFRRRTPSSVTFLDQFIKYTSMDGSLVVKAPFHLKCSGSYFDDNKLNIEMNKKMGAHKEAFYKEEKERRREEVSETIEDLEDTILKDFDKEKEELEQVPMSRNQDNGAGIFVEVEDMKMLRDITEVERKILDQLSGTTTESILESINSKTRSPLHLRLYGRSHHRIDSYSILRGKSQSTHIYISDAASTEEAVSMFVENGNGGTTGTFSHAGSVSIWRPRQVSEVEISETLSGWNKEEEVASAFKIYCPNHVLDPPDHGIKAVFFCPTLMNKLYLESERHGCIEVDCKLMDQLVTVGLFTEYGNIRIRDVWAQDIKLASRFGDIYCEGTVEGAVTAETFGDGDFVARYIVGSRLKVTTDSGDISLWNDCFTELCELYTVTGHIHVRFLYGKAKILVKDQGSVVVNVVEGSVTAVVKSGTIWANIDKLTEDSYLEVEDGDITVNVPPDFPFKLNLVASRTNVASHILNSGELFLASNGQESFVKQGEIGKSGDIQPTLSIRTHNGEITLTGTRPEKQGEKGFDSS